MTGCKMVDRGIILLKAIYFFCLIVCLCLHTCDADRDPRKVCKHVPEKKIDTAFVTMSVHGHTEHNVEVNLYTITTECYTCDLQLTAVVEPHHSMCTVLVDTRWKMKVNVSTNSTQMVVAPSCSVNNLSQWFMEGGNYSMIVMVKSSEITCEKLVLQNNPMDSNIPIYVAMGVFVGLILMWWFLKYMYSPLAESVPAFAPSSDQDRPAHLCCLVMISALFVIQNHVLRKLQGCLFPDSVSFIDPVTYSHGSDIKKDKLQKHLPSVTQYNLRRRKNTKSDSAKAQPKNDFAEQDLGVPTNTAEDDAHRPRKERLKSLDTFRGISIVVMIFVNYRGGDYWFFKHSKWNGLTVADLVFPWFVWIMGTAMAYSFHTQLRRSTPKTKMFWKILKRSCILFALGLLINSSDGLNPVRMREFRIPGVLQRFAGTYLIIATLHMFFAKPNDPNQYTWWSPFRDITDYWFEWVFNIVLVILWLALTFVMEVPGCPKGYLGPGGLANDHGDTNVSLCTGGAASYIDRKIFGEGRIYQGPTCKEIYDTTVPHDPEGLLGTLTSCFMCFLGLQAGKILRLFPDWKARVKRFLIWGVVLGIIAVILCKGEKNGGFIPINKNLWSLSFVICLSCFAFFLFAFCYVTIDVYKVWSGAPFYYPGMNAILLYLGHEFFSQPFRTFWGIHPNSHTVYLPINLWDTAVWILLSYYLYYKEIFISV